MVDGCRNDIIIGQNPANQKGIERNVYKCLQTPNGKIGVEGTFFLQGLNAFTLIQGTVLAVEEGTTFYNVGEVLNLSNPSDITEIECIKSGCDCDS